ncbi:gp34.41 [Bacillus phage SPO1]|uniref:Gp34.41 n=2 Tax=Okubovirus TaxID=1857845 RepID=B6V2U7_BPSP1|nr:gp34.41 [Bacillus phage SPO1]YP_008770110.1 hypothetical protein CampHawk_176 [Bacillus phage CampHawk]ACI91077.1 gp34.41 [Bacillus phage SPO1]AGY47054.1 hypothetical protein CampHawk_176 [Bacillus phage CampHawk]WIT26510.1 hypothetical protein [Bacillus phage SPO1L4]
MMYFLFKLVYDFFGYLTGRPRKSDEPYVSRFSGEWVRRNKNGAEHWEWVEKTRSIRPLYVSVFNMADDYIIKVGYNRRGAAIETHECKDSKEAKIAVDLLTAYYKPLGNVFTSEELE